MRRSGPRRIGFAFASALWLACAGGSGPRAVVYETGSRAEATADGLHRVRAQRTDALFVLPGAQLGAYTRLAIAPVEVYYKEAAAGERPKALGPLEREWFDGMVRRELRAAFEHGADLELVDAAAPDVLLLRAQFVDMLLGKTERPDVGRVSVLTSSEFRLILDLSDSVAGESLLRQVDFRRLSPTSLGSPGLVPRATPVSPSSSEVEESAALRQAIGNRARTLRESFDALRRAGPLAQPGA